MTKEERKEYNKQYYLANKEKAKQYSLDNKKEKKEYNKQHYLDNKEYKKEKSKQYYLDNKEKVKEQHKQYYLGNKEKRKEYNLDNKEKLKEKGKQYYLDNKEYKKEKSKQYYLDNKKEIKEYIKQYNLDNKKERKEYHKQYRLGNKEKANEYAKNRRKTDPIFRMISNIRASIRGTLKNKGYTKKTNTYKILGCEYDFFSSYLGLQNYNEDSHLDHVIPVSLADTEEEVILLNHYSNFQLLPSIENIVKGNRFVKIENYMRVLHNHPNPNKLKQIVNRSDINIM